MNIYPTIHYSSLAYFKCFFFSPACRYIKIYFKEFSISFLLKIILCWEVFSYILCISLIIFLSELELWGKIFSLPYNLELTSLFTQVFLIQETRRKYFGQVNFALDSQRLQSLDLSQKQSVIMKILLFRKDTLNMWLAPDSIGSKCSKQNLVDI